MIAADRLCWLLGGYAVLHILVVLFLYQGLLPSAAGLAIDLRYVVFFGLVYVALKLLPEYRRQLIWIGVGGACVVVGFATLQFFLPADILSHIGYSKDTIMPYLTVDKNPDFIRVNSTLRGPNPLGAYAGMALSLLVAAVVRARLTLTDKRTALFVSVFSICSIVALWLSYSRSALVAALISLSVIFFATAVRRLSPRIWIVSCVLVCAVLGGLIVNRDSAFVSNVLLHENRDGGSAVSSNEEHVSSLEYGLDRLVHQPLGAGVGSTGSAALYGDGGVVIENQYLFIAHEVGWLGIILFLLIFITILYRLWQGRSHWLSLGIFASGVGLGLIGLLQPVWVDDTVSIVWWGLAAIALARKGIYGHKTK